MGHGTQESNKEVIKIIFLVKIAENLPSYLVPLNEQDPNLTEQLHFRTYVCVSIYNRTLFC